MALTTMTRPVVLEAASQSLSTRLRRRPSSTSSRLPRPARCSTTSRPHRSTSCPLTTAGSRCRPRWRRARADRTVAGRRRDAAGNSLHARRRLGARERDTHDRLVRELAVGTGAAVVFVEYDRSPEAHYPVAIEQGYATAQWIVREGAANGLDPDRIAVAGDSVGGGMTAALALMANERGDVHFVQQSMYYPVTDAAMDTGSFEQFAEGYFLAAKGMAWFWDAYLPDVEQRSELYASPLRATEEQLVGLPPAFVIVDEADVLRDEGEAYAARLRAAGVPVTTVRYDGITHDFMMLNPLSSTQATRAAVAQAISFLRAALHSA